MATFTGTGGTMTLNGKEFALADLSFNETIAPTTEEDHEPFSLPEFKEWTLSFGGTFNSSHFWWLWLLPCKVTISRYGRDFVFDGMCNEEKTRVYLESNVAPGKYFLKHLDDDGKTLRHERVTHDVDDARQWVIGGSSAK